MSYYIGPDSEDVDEGLNRQFDAEDDNS